MDILLADNQDLTIKGMQCILSEDKSLRIAGIARAQDSLHTLVEAQRPALVIADYNLPNYFQKEHIADLQRRLPWSNILIVSADDNRASILEMVKAGVKGYITKQSTQQEFMTAVKTVGAGGKYFCQKVLDIILDNSLAPDQDVRKGKSSLSERERELLLLLAKGYSTHRAAEKLNLSPHTIHSHRKNIIKKLNIKSPTQYVLYAMDLGLM